MSDPDRLELERYCLHCSLGTEYRRNRLRLEIETAVKRLAKRLGNRGGGWPRNDDSNCSTTGALQSTHASTGSLPNAHQLQQTPQSPQATGGSAFCFSGPASAIAQAEQLRRTMGTPDIVVSSISSDEETDPAGRQTSSDRCSSYPTSGETR